jgi:hypothetical protein
MFVCWVIYLCAMGIDFASSYDFQLDFETVPTVLYCLCFVHVFINCSDSVVLFVVCTRALYNHVNVKWRGYTSLFPFLLIYKVVCYIVYVCLLYPFNCFVNRCLSSCICVLVDMYLCVSGHVFVC